MMVLSFVALIALLTIATLPREAEGAGNCKVKYKFKVGNPKLLFRYRNGARDQSTLSYNSIDNPGFSYNAGWKGSIRNDERLYYRASPVGDHYCKSPCKWVLFAVSTWCPVRLRLRHLHSSTHPHPTRP